MASTANATRADVLRALAECGAKGVDAFLAEHGYGASKRFHLVHEGRRYPSKAILGVAAGLRARDLFGGAAHTVRTLVRLGFQVREGERQVADLGLVAVARELEGELTPAARPELPVEPVAYFASGSNRVGEIRGLALVGQDIGVAAPHVTPKAEAELAALAGTDVQVFVDSGAFSEVEFTSAGPVVVDEITHEEWERRLALYARLAAALGDQLWIVAPDRVGDQAVTLERLALYRVELMGIQALGARILVPMQRGAMSQAEFARCVDAILAGVEWLPALPCKKAATSLEELRAFLRERRPAHVHLLGLGVRSTLAPAFLGACEAAGSTASCDSNWIAANVGRKSGTRLYTKAQDLARKMIAAGRVAADRLRELALMLAFGLSRVALG